MTRNVIIVLLLLAVAEFTSSARENSAAAAQAKAKLRTHSKSHTKHTLKMNGSTNAPDDDADDASDDDSDDTDDSPTTTNPALAEAHDALHDVQWRSQTNEAHLDGFKDVQGFKKEVAREEKLVANQTQSEGLAEFLSDIRLEMRTYATPTYQAHLEAKQHKLDEQEKFIEAQIAKLENRTVQPATKQAEGSDKKSLEVVIAPVESKELVADEAEIKELKEKIKEQGGGGGEAGHVFAFAFLGTVTMIACVFAMANNGDVTVKNYTWFLLDQVVAVFLAVMYFQAFDDLLDFLDFGGHHKVLAACIHAMLMLTLALVLAFMLRGQEVGLAILCGAGAHVTSFTSIHAAAVVQNNVWLGIDFLWVWCLIGLTVLAVAMAAICAAVFKAKQFLGVSRDDGFMDKTDDMENDFGAMAFSVCWSMFIRFLISGHHPVDDDTDFDHTPANRHLMLANGVLCLVVAVLAVPYTARTYKNYFLNRATNFASTVLAMNVAWSFFYWAEWELFETAFKDQPIFGRIAFALISTVFGSVGIFVLARLPSKDGRVKKVALTAMGLMVAWSWELCFDAAIDDMCEGRSHPALYKMGATVFMFLIVIPVYGIYMKPISMPAAEAIGA